MKKIILVFLLCISGLQLKGQSKLDTLLAIWEDSSQRDSVRVVAYKDYILHGFLYTRPDSAILMAEGLHNYAHKNDFLHAVGLGYGIQGAANYILGNYSLALKCHQKALVVSEKIGDKSGIANSLTNIGTVYLNQQNFPMALESYQKVLAIREELGEKKNIAGILVNFGGIYLDQGNYLRALGYFEKSMTIGEELGDKWLIAANLNNIGQIYDNQGNTSRALEKYERSLEIFDELGDKHAIAATMGNIGRIYFQQDQYTRALEYLEKSLVIYESMGSKQDIARALANIGNIYQVQEQSSRALDYYEKSLALNEEIGDKKSAASCLVSISSIYRKQGNYTLALGFCQKGLFLAEEIGTLEEQKESLHCMYDTYKAMGKGNEALEHLEKLRMVEDSLQVEETGKKLQQMEFAKVMLQDSLAKAEEARLVQETHQEEVRKKNKVRNVFMGSSLFLLLIAGGFYSRWRFVRKAHDTISKEKDRSEILLLNILPAEIAAELKEKGRTEARDFDMVSILFTDFKEFTRASEKLSAQELVSEINACFEAFDTICERYQIEKIKTIGDAYMAAGGLPVPSDDSVENTVLAALEMQAFINQRKAENKSAGLPAFEMRVGVHTGPVVAGIVGVKKFQYDLWGDTVNTAARMESSGEVGMVNISEATYELVKDHFECTYRGEVEAKGKGKLGMYFVNEHTIA